MPPLPTTLRPGGQVAVASWVGALDNWVRPNSIDWLGSAGAQMAVARTPQSSTVPDGSFTVTVKRSSPRKIGSMGCIWVITRPSPTWLPIIPPPPPMIRVPSGHSAVFDLTVAGPKSVEGVSSVSLTMPDTAWAGAAVRAAASRVPTPSRLRTATLSRRI